MQYSLIMEGDEKNAKELLNNLQNLLRQPGKEYSIIYRSVLIYYVEVF